LALKEVKPMRRPLLAFTFVALPLAVLLAVAGGRIVRATSDDISQASRPAGSAGIEIEKIKPGMNKEDLDRVRQEISRLASQALRGQ